MIADMGVNGFDSERSVRGSVQVQARDHLERHRNKISANREVAPVQKDYALASY